MLEFLIELRLKTDGEAPGAIKAAVAALESGQITGSLKELRNEMSKDLSSATSEKEVSIKEDEELISAEKTKVAALTASVETKTQRISELAVEMRQIEKMTSLTQKWLS